MADSKIPNNALLTYNIPFTSAERFLKLLFIRNYEWTYIFSPETKKSLEFTVLINTFGDSTQEVFKFGMSWQNILVNGDNSINNKIDLTNRAQIEKELNSLRGFIAGYDPKKISFVDYKTTSKSLDEVVSNSAEQIEMYNAASKSDADIRNEVELSNI